MVYSCFDNVLCLFIVFDYEVGTVYANGEVLMQHNGNHTAEKYFYLHDRLGSIRQIIDPDAIVVRYYTYKPFGEVIETGGTFDNPFMFTGQWYDPEIS